MLRSHLIHALVTFKNRALTASTRYPPEYAVVLSSEKPACKLVLNLAKIPMAAKIEAELRIGGASVAAKRFQQGTKKGSPRRSFSKLDFSSSNNLFGCSVSFANCIPVNHIEKRSDVIWSPVLVVEIVGVLPYVQAQQWRAAFHQWVVLVGGAFDD